LRPAASLLFSCGVIWWVSWGARLKGWQVFSDLSQGAAKFPFSFRRARASFEEAWDPRDRVFSRAHSSATAFPFVSLLFGHVSCGEADFRARRAASFSCPDRSLAAAFCKSAYWGLLEFSLHFDNALKVPTFSSSAFSILQTSTASRGGRHPLREHRSDFVVRASKEPILYDFVKEG